MFNTIMKHIIIIIIITITIIISVIGISVISVISIKHSRFRCAAAHEGAKRGSEQTRERTQRGIRKGGSRKHITFK